MDRDTRESYIIAKRSQRCTPRTGRDAHETHRSRCIAKDIYILKRNSRREERHPSIDGWMKERSRREESHEKSRVLFFEEFERRMFSRKRSARRKQFRSILFRFSNKLGSYWVAKCARNRLSVNWKKIDILRMKLNDRRIDRRFRDVIILSKYNLRLHSLEWNPFLIIDFIRY